MVSIGHYVLADSQTEDTLHQVVRMLVEGIECHAVKGPPEEIVRLHQATRRVLETLGETLGRRAPADDLLNHVTSALDVLKQYNERAVGELELKVRLLTDAIASVSSTSSENIRRLQQIKSQMSSSLGVKEIRSLRMLLSECVDGVLAEAEHQRAQSDQAGEQLNRTYRLNPPESGGPEPATDPTTGFQVRVHAEEVIAQACQDQCTVFAVVMVINQIQNVNRSLGREVGDAMLQRFAGFMREHLPAVDLLFRWSGPTVVAILRRRSMLAVRAAVEPLLVQRLTVKADLSDVQVPISSRWTVLPVTQPSDALFQKIDCFADSE
jgi:GGDEF domain-containing protein